MFRATGHRARAAVALLGLAAGCAAERPVAPADRVFAPPPVAAPPAAASVVADAAAEVDAGDGSAVFESRPLDRAALERLVADARATGSDDLVLIKDDQLVGEWHFKGPRTPIQTMSLTKSVLSLLVGTLIDAGKLKLETPVAEFFSEWRTGEKQRITLFHLLSHSSGLEEGKTARAIYRSQSFVDFTLRSKLLFEPGTHYEYSNRAANLLSALIGKAAGMPTDRYAAKVLFTPLGIGRYEWEKDRAGNVQGLAGLKLLPRDVAKLGELVLGQGSWRGQRVVSAAWIERSTSVPVPVQPTNKRLALLWWMIPEWTKVRIDDGIVAAWREAGTDPEFLAKVAPLVGRSFDSVHDFVATLRTTFDDPKLVDWAAATYERGVPDARFEFGPITGVYSAGTLGQYLVVVPRDRLVAVRMRRGPASSDERDEVAKTFPDFVDRARGLVLAR